MGRETPNHWVDVTDTFGLKQEALLCHVSQLTKPAELETIENSELRALLTHEPRRACCQRGRAQPQRSDQERRAAPDVPAGAGKPGEAMGDHGDQKQRLAARTR